MDKPILSLSANKVKAGSAITLTCNVTAKPAAPMQYVFYKGGVKLDTTTLNTHQFTVGRDDQGPYSCKTSNEAGNQTSELSSLTVICMYA